MICKTDNWALIKQNLTFFEQKCGMKAGEVLLLRQKIQMKE